ncbi:sugar phosphate isomerase/epimerase family protein [Microbacterium murale]|uniref:D-psicose/D-tagatose/L-ribulose 3-epimerase n=1 Tax=Microbacterium murale TaxID=1081040 RepID=A0ABU0P7C3_9MICO|nr:sugar phosphate isomerase/epimerase family protein [Microbacterium murale]MDQ0643235.1 D-psicose/D-tagatose/L-ribulose 3-epimerase [Microbacterium murale]
MDLDLSCHLSIITGETDRAGLAPILGGLREMGYRRAVLAPMDEGATDAAALRAVFVEAGIAPITMCGQGPGADVSSSDAAERAAGAATLRASVDFAVRVGADQINGVPYGLFGRPVHPLAPAAFERSAREVGVVADYAADHGVQLTFEVLNRYEEAAINTAAQAMEYVSASGSDNLGIHLDTFHMAIEEADMNEAIRHALPHLRYLELGQSGRGLLSTGSLDIPGVVAAALDDGYGGRIGVEAFSRPLLARGVADMLSIWRSPFQDGLEVAADAVRVIRKGWAESGPGRRARRLSRAGA